MKRLLALILILCLVFTLAACGNKEDYKDTTASIPSTKSTESADNNNDENSDVKHDASTIDTDTQKDIMPAYKMAKIDTDSAVSTSKYGFSKTSVNYPPLNGLTSV